jgi:hypothetical protein
MSAIKGALYNPKGACSLLWNDRWSLKNPIISEMDLAHPFGERCLKK